MNLTLSLILKIKASQRTVLSILILVIGSAQLCFANEPTYDGKPLFVVGPIVHANGTRSLSGQTYNRPTAAGSFTFNPAGDYFVDPRVVNSTYFFKQSSLAPMVRTAIYAPSSCQERYGSNYPGVDKGLVTYSYGATVVVGLGCVNISGGSLGWDFVFSGPIITYDPSKFNPAIPLDNGHGIPEDICPPNMLGG